MARGREPFLKAFGKAVLRPVDPVLAIILGLLLIYSLTIMASAMPENVSTQLGHFTAAIVLMWIVAALPVQRILSIAPALYVVGLLLLVAVDLAGEVSMGARRWLHLGIIRFQPSELMKIAMPLTLAWFFQKREGYTGWQEFVVAAVILAIPVALIAKQPDLGTAVLVVSGGIFLMYFSGLSWKLIIPVAILGVAAIVSFEIYADTACEKAHRKEWPVLKPYQVDRICTLNNPDEDPRGKGFHIIQSKISIGSGGVIGKGLGHCTQTHLDFLPERHTDFVFAVVAEELGIVGALVLLGLYLALLLRCFFITARATSLGTRVLAGTMTMMFFTYIFVNIGMVSGMLPVVGVPLPFISYGGTAVVTLCVAIGILMSIRRSSHS